MVCCRNCWQGKWEGERARYEIIGYGCKWIFEARYRKPFGKAGGVTVVAVDKDIAGWVGGAECISADIFHIPDPFQYFGRPDCVLHLAWRDGFKHFSPNHIKDLPEHVGFIEKICKAGTKELCVLGSMHEVGFFEGSIQDQTPCRPLSYYGIAKNALREACEIIAKQNQAKLKWLRGFYIVGNTGDGCSIFSKIVQAAGRGQRDFPFTMGYNQFDFLDYDTFCRMAAAAVVQDSVDGIINICSGRPEKLSERVERFIKENHYEITLQYGAYPDRPYDSKAVWGNAAKINAIMGMEG